MKQRVMIGPILLALGLAMFRVAFILLHYQPLSPWGVAEPLILNEASVTFLIIPLLLLTPEFSSWRIVRWVLGACAILWVVYYGIDTAILFSLGRSPSLGEIVRFTPEVGAVSSFFNLTFFAVTLCSAALLFLTGEFSAASRRFSAVGFLIVAIFAIPEVVLPPTLRDQKWHPLDQITGTNGYWTYYPREYTPSDISLFPSFTAPQLSPGILKRERVILLMIEGLSQADSRRAGGIRDFLPIFDELTRKGTLFTNCIASYVTSEGSYVGLMQGIPPIPFPGSTDYLFDDFMKYPSLVPQFKEAGFYTEYIQGAYLDFLSRRQFNEYLGFDLSQGRDEIKRFAGLQWYAFNSPPDEALYDEAIDRVQNHIKENEKFFQVLFTVSSHTPWVNPEDGKNDEVGVWQYVQKELSRFVTELEVSHFFDSGVLIITGDHRKMTTIAEAEEKRFGPSAAFRVPLLIIGKGFEAGRIDSRLVAQYDILPKFTELAIPDEEVSPFALGVTWITPRLNKADQANGTLLVVEEGARLHSSYLDLRGANARWQWALDPHPVAITTKIHSQRIFGQAHSAPDQKCAYSFEPRRLYPVGAHVQNLTLMSYDAPLQSRNPDEISASAKTLTRLEHAELQSPALDELLQSGAREFEIQGYLNITEPANYLFHYRSADAHQRCISVDGRTIIGDGQDVSAAIPLSKGFHEIRIHGSPIEGALEWKKEGDSTFVPVDSASLIPAQ